MEDYIEYCFSYIETNYLDGYGDVNAMGSIDAFPMNKDGEQIADGYVIVKVFLTNHNDVVVSWNGIEGRLNPEVLELVEKAKIEIQEYR